MGTYAMWVISSDFKARAWSGSVAKPDRMQQPFISIFQAISLLGESRNAMMPGFVLLVMLTVFTG
jgi:hypothetical protein